VLGGTFDPPHRGHLALAAAAHEQLRLDRVLFVPAGVPYRKAAAAVTAASVRLRLVEAATAGLPWGEVSAIEVVRPGPTYTHETMEVLTRDGADWWFIAGADVLADLPHWRDPVRLVELARLAVVARPPVGRRVPPETALAIPGIEGRIDWLELKPLDVSSTAIRQGVAAGADSSEWLTEPVRALIAELGLYRARG
jgi:nicotinate-nucleotide adenylyltransferase